MSRFMKKIILECFQVYLFDLQLAVYVDFWCDFCWFIVSGGSWMVVLEGGTLFENIFKQTILTSICVRVTIYPIVGHARSVRLFLR